MRPLSPTKVIDDAKDRFRKAEKAGRLSCSNAEAMKRAWRRTQHALLGEGNVFLNQQVVFVPRGRDAARGLMRGVVVARCGIKVNWQRRAKLHQQWVFVAPRSNPDDVIAFKDRDVWPLRN